MRISISIVLLFLTSILSFSQNDYLLTDYIIDHKNDTIFGLTERAIFPMKISFTKNGESEKIRADKINGFKKGEKYYSVKSVYEMPLYLGVLINDKVSLYELGDHVINTSSEYYVEKSDSLFVVRDDRRFIETLRKLFSDYKDLVAAINNKSYSYSDTPEIIRIYNEWIRSGTSSIDPCLINTSFKNYAKGYLILKSNNDTIFGFIQKLNGEFGISFKYLDGKVEKYKLESVSEFSTNNTKYKVIYRNEYIICKICFDGKTKLLQKLETYDNYERTSPISKTIINTLYGESGHNKTLFIQKQEQEDLEKVANNKLLRLFGDNEILLDKISKGYYDIWDIETIFKIYDNTK